MALASRGGSDRAYREKIVMTQPFKCPSCGGPLEYDGGDITVRCHYCTNHVIVPEELRPGAGYNAAQAPLPNQLHNLAEIGRLIRSGNKIAAIKLYRETFGVGLREAKDAVENLAAGRAVEVSRSIESQSQVRFDPQQMLNWFPPQEQLVHQAKRGCSLVFWGILLSTIATIAGIGIAVYYAVRSTQNMTHPTATKTTSRNRSTGPSGGAGTNAASGPASVLLAFGSEGIGAGQFKDARSIAVDASGHIYVGEYTGGRVQVFDADGKFVKQWMVDAKMPLLQLAADRQGTVYVVQSGEIARYEGLTGRPLGKLPGMDRSAFVSDVALTMDGGMVVVQHGEDILSLDASGRVVRSIKAAISEQSGDSELSTRVAVDGLGNIYAAGRFNNAIFKFGPNGKYITRFGGKGDGPGQFRALDAIAADGQGRVFVGDFSGIQMFDSNGRYLDTVTLEHNIAFGMIFNDRNELFVAARTRVYKLAIDKQ